MGDMDVSDIIRNRMKEILENPDTYKFDEEINEVINDLREEYTNDDYLFVASKDVISIRTYKNSKINRTLAIMLNIASASKDYANNESDSTVYGPDTIRFFDEIRISPISKTQIYDFLIKDEALLHSYLSAYKYMVLIPDNLKVDYIINNRLDLSLIHI